MSLAAFKSDLLRALVPWQDALNTGHADRLSGLALPFGFRMHEPGLVNWTAYDCGHAADLERLSGLGMLPVSQADRCEGNRVWLAPDARVAGLSLRFEKSNCHVVIGPGRGVQGSIRLFGHHNLVMIGADSLPPSTFAIEMLGNGNVFLLAQHATTWGSHFTIGGEGRLMAVGEHAMLAMQTAVVNHDLHPVFALDQPHQVLNPPCDQLVFPQVWLARQVQVVKADMGYGAIAGTLSLVNRQIAPCTLVAGIPARVIRTGVSFDRSRNGCEPATLERLKQYETAFSGLFHQTVEATAVTQLSA